MQRDIDYNTMVSEELERILEMIDADEGGFRMDSGCAKRDGQKAVINKILEERGHWNKQEGTLI